MVSAVTEGVQVSVQSTFLPEYSSARQSHFVFSYKVTIENKSDYTVQLHRRHWHIFDSDGSVREVEGEGVIGQQPILEPGEVHQYISGCNFRTTMGKMKGTYLMERVFDGKHITVEIPEFSMIVPYRLN
jgi:ApaG protein